MLEKLKFKFREFLIFRYILEIDNFGGTGQLSQSSFTILNSIDLKLTIKNKIKRNSCKNYLKWS